MSAGPVDPLADDVDDDVDDDGDDLDGDDDVVLCQQDRSTPQQMIGIHGRESHAPTFWRHFCQPSLDDGDDDGDDYEDDYDIYIMVECISVCHKSHYFRPN